MDQRAFDEFRLFSLKMCVWKTHVHLSIGRPRLGCVVSRITRRAFGLGLGASLLCGSWLRGLSGPARANGPASAKRLVVFFTPNGTVHNHWRPQGSGQNFTLAEGSILEPLGAHASGLAILDGIDFYGTSNHEGGMSHMLTGGGALSDVGQGASIDQFVAKQIGSQMPFPSLELGVQTSAWGGNVQTRMCYAGPGAYVPPEDNPAQVYSRLMDKVVAEPSAGPSPTEIRRKRVLDLVNEELNVLRSALGSAEQLKLDQHLDAIHQLESSLSVKGLCAEIDAPEALSVYDNESFPLVARAQVELLTTAFACGMTRVATLQLSHTVGPPVFSWLGISQGHHSLSHTDDSNTAGMANFVAAERWFAGEFAWLLDRLAATEDAEFGGTLLDNTLVVWAQELGDGRLHECKSVPFVLAGAKGVLQGGQYLDFGGAPHQKLLVSISQIMGIDIPSFGNPTYGTGGLAGLV